MSHYFTDVQKNLTNQGRGRPKGSLNRTHATVRWSLIEAFRLTGGVQALVKWGKANPDLFYPMLTKLLPTELAEAGYSGDNRIQVVILPPGQAQSQVAEVGRSDEQSHRASIPSVSKPNDVPVEHEAGGMLPKGQGHDEDSEA